MIDCRMGKNEGLRLNILRIIEENVKVWGGGWGGNVCRCG